MELKDAFHFGKIIKAFGARGEVVFFLDVDEPEKYEGLEFVFVMRDGFLIPYHILSLDISGMQARVKLEDIDDPSGSQELVGSELYLPLDQLPDKQGKKVYYHEITGFAVFDENIGWIGTVESVLDREEQPLLVIRGQNKEILFPFVDDIITSIDMEKKEIIAKAPEGLLDLND